MADEKKPEEKKDKGKDAKDKKAEPKRPVTPGDPGETSKVKIFLESLSPRERTIATVAAVIVAAVLIDGIVIRPISRNLEQIDGRIKESETIIPKRLMILRHGEKIMRNYDSLSSFMTPADVTREEEIAKLLGDIERVSNETGLFISNINPVEVVTELDDRYFLKVAIDGKGQMSYIRQYIMKLEETSPGIRVGSYSFVIKKKGSDELTYSMTILKLGIRPA